MSNKKLDKAEDLFESVIDALSRGLKKDDLKTIEVAIGFLKDQGIDCQGTKNTKIKELTKELPDQKVISGKF